MEVANDIEKWFGQRLFIKACILEAPRYHQGIKIIGIDLGQQRFGKDIKSKGRFNGTSHANRQLVKWGITIDICPTEDFRKTTSLHDLKAIGQ